MIPGLHIQYSEFVYRNLPVVDHSFQDACSHDTHISKLVFDREDDLFVSATKCKMLKIMRDTYFVFD